MPGFDAWTRALEEAGAKVFNDPALARWNNDKTTLVEIADRLDRRVSFPRTLRVASLADAPAALGRLGSTEAVLKPAWGGSGVGVERVTPETVDTTVARLARERGGDRPYLVQGYLPEIAAGEVSFVFVDGAFTHAVLNLPAAGEFRVNNRFAPQPPRLCGPPAAALADAQAVLAAVGAPTLYARIDGVLRGERLVCTEVELTDPWLHFDLAPAAAERMADALHARLG